MKNVVFNTYGIFADAPLAASGKPALISDGLAFSYCGIRSRILSIALFLSKKGVGKGVRVGLWLPNSNRSIELYFALSYLGAVSVPVRRYASLETTADILNRARVEVLFAYSMYRAEVREMRSRLLHLSFCLFLGSADGELDCYEDAASGEPADFPPAEMSAGDLNMILFTSGTTGKPKIFEISCSSLIFHVTDTHEPIVSSNERNSLLCIPFFHLCAWMHGLSCIKKRRAAHS